MDPEIRISPDGQAVAIRTEYPEDAWNAWGVMHRRNGGSWTNSQHVAEWSIVTTTT